jgi:hypothetical protein
MVVLVVTGLRAALEMSRVSRMRVVGEGRSSTPKGHAQRQHKRRDQQRYTPLHLLSPPIAHSAQHHRPKERDVRRGRHTLKPHPFCYVLGGGALSLGLSLSWPHHLSAAWLPLSCGEVHGLCAPASQRVRPYRDARASALVRTILPTWRRPTYRPHGHFSQCLGRLGCMPGSYS